MLDLNRFHHVVDHSLGRLPRARHREKLRIVHGRATGHVDALEEPRDVATDGKHLLHPIDRDGMKDYEMEELAARHLAGELVEMPQFESEQEVEDWFLEHGFKVEWI